MIQLYHHPMSGASRYVRLIFGEYGIAAELVEEKVWLRRADFLAINAAGTVPVMLDEAAVDPRRADGPPPAIAGGVVIGEYLDETVGAMSRDRRLMPENSAARAEVRRLVEWFLVKFEAEVAQHLVHERVFKQLMRADEGGGSPDSAIIRAGRNNLKAHLRYLDWLVQSRNWLAGNRLTLADIAAAAALSVLDYLGEVGWDSEPAVRDWYARLKSRPSFRALLADKVAGLPPASHYVDLDF
ncbi:MAG: glutathione S-transferase family protein [Nitratireductor sp.]|nr:glutathione S-transferase family protein [Nitratireductor sp.]